MAMDEYQTPEMAFTSTVLEKIEDLLDCKEITKEHCVITKSDGSVTGEIHAYSESTNGEVLYLFHTIYNHSSEIKTKSNTDCQTSFSRIQGFYNASAKAAYDSMDSQSSEYRASKFIYDNNHNYKSVNLIVLSNYLINNVSLKKIRIVSKPVFYDVWDLRKIYGNTHSMTLILSRKSITVTRFHTYRWSLLCMAISAYWRCFLQSCCISCMNVIIQISCTTT